MMYDELIYHLDLCILAYHLHSQTLIWPTDPYYEQQLYRRLDSDQHYQHDRRKSFMSEVRQSFRRRADFHGPGSCQGWVSNISLDPVITDYRRLRPWHPSFIRGYRHQEPWGVYYSPHITDRIAQVYMMRHTGQQRPTSTFQETLFGARPAGTYGPPATDRLYGFEGGTGAIDGSVDGKQYASWSMMGFVLARKVVRGEVKTADPNVAEPYDVHIVFRGSRSGRVGFRPLVALTKEKGSPDWVTDMDFNTVVRDDEVSSYGSVCRGFATSIKSIFPTIMASLVHVHNNFPNPPAPPRTIYVTGHSLGGALACHFASAMIMGGDYGPSGTGTKMPNALRTWPWRSMQLITFSAPVVGGGDFHEAFNNSIASRRVWREGEPVTHELRHYPVGIPYRLPVLLGGVRGRRGHRQEVIPMSHHPRLIREDLLAHRRKHGFPTEDVPKEEPWRDFPNCTPMLEYFETLAERKGFHTEELFPNFVEHLVEYVDILQRTLEGKNAPGRVYRLVKGCIPADEQDGQGGQAASEYRPINPFDPETAKARWDYLREDVGKFDMDLYRYLGLCLALALVSRGENWRVFRDLLNTI